MSEDDKKKQLSLEFESEPEKSEPNEPTEIVDGEVLEWVCHPAKQNKTRTVIVTAFIVLVILGIYFWTFSAFLTILGVIILTGSLAAYYFPTRYTLTENEILIRTTTQRQTKKWSQYRSYYPDKNGVLLSPFVRPSRLENFRGVYIRFSGNKDTVMAYVIRKIEDVRKRGLGETD